MWWFTIVAMVAGVCIGVPLGRMLERASKPKVKQTTTATTTMTTDNDNDGADDDDRLTMPVWVAPTGKRVHMRDDCTHGTSSAKFERHELSRRMLRRQLISVQWCSYCGMGMR